MSYLMFLILFVGLPMIILIFLLNRTTVKKSKELFWGTVTLIVLAVSYTTPWDNYLVATKVWWYGADRVIGTIGYVPIEEYCFFITQTILVALWCTWLQKTMTLQFNPTKSPVKHLVTVLYIALFFIGVFGFANENMTYLSLILSWAMPVLLLQWVIGGQYLISNYKLFLSTFLVPGIYLSLADSFAIYDKIWAISDTKTTGIVFGNLPLEEATFFFVTSIMVAQGLILFVVMEEQVQKVLSFKRKLFS